MEIHWRNPRGVSPEERDAAEARLRALTGERGDVIDLWIDLAALPHHRLGGARATIRAQVRRGDLVAQGRGAELDLALRDAVDTFARELRKRRARRAPQPPDFGSVPPLRGVIDRVDPGGEYGFLISESGERVYFHRNALRGGLELSNLEGGESVAFNIEAGDEGAQATVVLPPPPAQR